MEFKIFNPNPTPLLSLNLRTEFEITKNKYFSSHVGFVGGSINLCIHSEKYEKVH